MAVENARDRAEDSSPAPSISRFHRIRTFMPWWVSLGLIAIVLGFVRSIVSGVGAADEAWFLYVLHRLDLGQTLYRDVWVPVFPFAVWVGEAFTKLLGNHVFVLKLVDTLAFTGTAIATVSVARRLFPNSRYYGALILAVLLGWTGPGVIGPGSLYTAFAYALTAATLAIVLAWVDSGAEGRTRSIPLLLISAVTTGLAFSSKQTIGVLAIGALLLTVLVVGGRREIRRSIGLAAAAAGVFAVTVLVTMIPAALSGGLPALLRDTLSSSGSSSYLSMASVPYLAGLGQFAQQLLNPLSPDWGSRITMYAAFLVPLVAVPVFAWAMTENRDIRTRAIGIFCLAALGGTYPRADYPHYIAALPFLVLALIVAWEAVKPQVSDPARSVAMVVAVVLIGVRLTSVALAPWGVGDSGLVVSQLPYFQGSLLAVPDDRAANTAAEVLRDAPYKTVFILSLRAGLMYLSSGREDPTAYDFPDLYGFGSFEQDDVINAVEVGRIDAIWFDPGVLAYLGWEDSRIMAYVKNAMHPIGKETPWGQLYIPGSR